MEPPWRRVMDAGPAMRSLIAKREVGKLGPGNMVGGIQPSRLGLPTWDPVYLLSDSPSTTLSGNQCPHCTSSLLVELDSRSSQDLHRRG